MKNRLTLALGALVLTLAATAYADFNVLDKTTWYQNGANGARVTSAGHATVVEQNSLMDANLTFQSIIDRRAATTTTLAAGAGDSSTVLDTHRMKLGMLLIKACPSSATGAGDTNLVVRLAVQIRTHLNGLSDTASTFPLYQYGKSDIGAQATTANQTDSLVVGHINLGNNLAASANNAHSGEFIILVDMRRMSGANANARPWAQPNGMAIPLPSLFGRDVYSPYTSVRVRNLGNGGAANRACDVTVHLVGTPL